MSPIEDYTPKLKISELDGDPSGRPRTLKVTNGTLKDNGEGSFTLTCGGGSVTDISSIPIGDTDTYFTFSGDTLTLWVNGQKAQEWTKEVVVTPPQPGSPMGLWLPFYRTYATT